jgi:hypothetical protein
MNTREFWTPEPKPIICTCHDCGKKFRFGDEGSNAAFCLRCEYLYFKFREEHFTEELDSE